MTDNILLIYNISTVSHNKSLLYKMRKNVPHVVDSISKGTDQAFHGYYAKYQNYESNSGNIEMEARFGSFDQKGFNSSVSPAAFNRVKDFFMKQSNFTVTTTNYNVKSMNFDKNKKIRRITQSNKSDKWEMKTRLSNIDIKEYGIRFAINLEQEIQAYPEEHFTPDNVRRIQRTSYERPEFARVDLSIIVDEVSPDNNIYEVEFEMFSRVIENPQFQLAYKNTVQHIYLLILNSHKIYTIGTRDNVIQRFNTLLGSKKKYYKGVDKNLITQARNIKYRDLVHGGLIGDSKTNYVVTHKADGLRKFFFIYKGSLWLISSSGEVDKLFTINDELWDDTILDCELIPRNRRRYSFGAPKVNYWLVVLDGLVIGGVNHTQSHHEFRIRHAQNVVDYFQNNSHVRLTTKSFTSIDDSRKLFNQCIQLRDEIPKLSYQSDGFMFIPNRRNYVPDSPNPDSQPLHRRCLNQIPDIVKWKPRNEITIDFMINKTNDGEYQLLVGRKLNNNTFETVEFVGSNFSPFNRSMINTNNILLQNASTGDVIEFEWDSDNQLMNAKQIRSDKRFPNREDIALDNWSDINDPITIEVMTGQTLRLMRKYHNRIKRGLFDNVISKHPRGNLLDIGTGRGGDISKMTKFSKIVMVEPNYDHITILLGRLSKTDFFKSKIYYAPSASDFNRATQLIADNGWSDSVILINNLSEINSSTIRVLILQSGGEDTELIYKGVTSLFGGLADVVSMMFSLSFFWQSEDNLNKLADTILKCSNLYAHFIFATVDGHAVQQIFEPPLGGTPIVDMIDHNNIVHLQYKTSEKEIIGTAEGNKDILNIKMTGPKSLEISFPGTIVGTLDEAQEEWLVIITDLETRLAGQGFKQLMYKRMDDETLLSPIEERLTQLYYAGILSRGDSSMAKSGPFILEVKADYIPIITTALGRFTIDNIGSMLDLGPMIDQLIIM